MSKDSTHKFNVTLSLTTQELERLNEPIRQEWVESCKRLEHMFNTRMSILELKLHENRKNYQKKLEECENKYRISEHRFNSKVFLLEQKLQEYTLQDREENYRKAEHMYQNRLVALENKLVALEKQLRDSENNYRVSKNTHVTELLVLEQKLQSCEQNYQISENKLSALEQKLQECEKKYQISEDSHKRDRFDQKSANQLDFLKTESGVVERSVLAKGEIARNLADPLNYSGLTTIPVNLTNGNRTFVRSICSEAELKMLMNNVQVVINYCEWLIDDTKLVATSFHIHICFTDKTVFTGTYIDALSANNAIKPLTIFKNIVTRYELPINGSSLPKLPLSSLRIKAHIEIPVNKSNRQFSVSHSVDFEFYANIKKYQKTVQLLDGEYAIKFSDIQTACDNRKDDYSSMLEEEYVTAQSNNEIPTSF